MNEMNRCSNKIITLFFLFSLIFFGLVEAKENVTINLNETPIVEINTTVSFFSNESKFRVGPTVRLRPLNSNIEKDKDGIVELFLNNPSLNDISLELDMSISVPSGIYIYGEDWGMSGGAETVVGHFSVPPGSSRTITLHIKGTEKGDFPVHFGGMYWPDGDKDKWNPISLDNSFKVIEPSSKIPESINPTNYGTSDNLNPLFIIPGLMIGLFNYFTDPLLTPYNDNRQPTNIFQIINNPKDNNNIQYFIAIFMVILALLTFLFGQGILKNIRKKE
jgi:hypothetical protein